MSPESFSFSGNQPLSAN